MGINEQPNHSVHYCEDCEHFICNDEPFVRVKYGQDALARNGDCWRSKKYRDANQYVIHPRDKELEICEDLNKDGLCADFKQSSNKEKLK